MAININVYDVTYNTTKTIAVDFIVGVIAYDDPVSTTPIAAFKFTTSARDVNNDIFSPRIVKGLDGLALNGNNQSNGGSASDYSDVKSMIIDYVYDMINGHTLGQSGSGCEAKAAMKFST